MTYLGAIFESNPLGETIWTLDIIASAVLAEVIGQYATYGGYIFVNNGGGTGETSFDGGGP